MRMYMELVMKERQKQKQKHANLDENAETDNPQAKPKRNNGNNILQQELRGSNDDAVGGTEQNNSISDSIQFSNDFEISDGGFALDNDQTIPTAQGPNHRHSPEGKIMFTLLIAIFILIYFIFASPYCFYLSLTPIN